MDIEQLLQLANSINCRYETGIWSEINSFMEYQNEKISKYVLSFNEENTSFYLNIKLKEHNISNVCDFFKLLVQFIEYGKATFYVKEEKMNTVEYYLLSSTNDKNAFLIQIIFS